MKILFVTAYAPSLIRTRALNFVKSLAAAGHAVTLATLWWGEDERLALRSLDATLARLIAERIHPARSLWNCVCALPGNQPLQAHYSWSPRLAGRIVRAVQTEDFDAIHVEHIRGARYALLVQDALRLAGRGRSPVIWDSVDCMSDLYRFASENSSALRWRLITRVELPRNERYEGRLTGLFDRVVVTSESDRQGLLKLAAKHNARQGFDAAAMSPEKIAVVPNGVDLDYFSPSGDARESHTLVFTGKMSYHANITAVVRFVHDVLPKIWEELPQTRLWVVGKDPPPEILKLGVPFQKNGSANVTRPGSGDPRIQITGTVEDIRPFLRKATVAVSPIRYAVGIQNKVLEAMACGTAVVSTPEATRALQIVNGRDLLVARGDQQLADAILCLLQDEPLRLDLGRSGRTFVENNHNWGAAALRLADIYREARK